MFVDWRSFGAAEKQGKKDSITFYTWANRKSFSEFYKFPILFECCEQIGNKIYWWIVREQFESINAGVSVISFILKSGGVVSMKSKELSMVKRSVGSANLKSKWCTQ